MERLKKSQELCQWNNTWLSKRVEYRPKIKIKPRVKFQLNIKVSSRIT